MKIIEFIKNEFTTANYLNRLIYINVIIFLIINIFSVGASLFLIETNDLIEKLMLPSEITEFIKQPWSLLTYMFLHENFIHLLFNMLWLHFGGKLFIEYLNEQLFWYIGLIWGCTTTSICSGVKSKSHFASITSNPLFISVAESIVIFAPIDHI